MYCKFNQDKYIRIHVHSITRTNTRFRLIPLHVVLNSLNGWIKPWKKLYKAIHIDHVYCGFLFYVLVRVRYVCIFSGQHKLFLKSSLCAYFLLLLLIHSKHLKLSNQQSLYQLWFYNAPRVSLTVEMFSHAVIMLWIFRGKIWKKIYGILMTR